MSKKRPSSQLLWAKHVDFSLDEETEEETEKASTIIFIEGDRDET